MKLSINMQLLLLILFCIAANFLVEVDSSRAMFNEWKTSFRKKFKDVDEEHKAYTNFLHNKDKVMKHNERFDRGEVSFKLRNNKRDDLSLEEKRASMNGFVMPQADAENLDALETELQALGAPPLLNRTFTALKLPTLLKSQSLLRTVYPPAPLSLDYRTLGYVTAVRDQGELLNDVIKFAVHSNIHR